jgi:cephalosporin-C deacetylase-like acetyl esterase
MPLPGDARFQRWRSRDDNNMLDCYLLAVRLADYLRSRDDVKWTYLFGASRSGPIMLACAALDPRKVRLVNVHVPTSLGLSWTGIPYHGWGSRPDPAVGAYLDPVNFAPELAVPVLLDGGIDDGLAPPQGMLAFANLAERAPWVGVSIERGGHGYFAKPRRSELRRQMKAFLDEGWSPPE